MSYRSMPSQEDSRLVGISDRERGLRAALCGRGLRDHRIEKIVKAFREYWSGSITKPELFRECKMKSLHAFERILGGFL